MQRNGRREKQKVQIPDSRSERRRLENAAYFEAHKKNKMESEKAR